MGAADRGSAAHDRLYTIEAVAEWLTVTPRTVRRWIHDDKMQSVRLGPHTLRVRESVVESFIEKRSTGNEEET